MLPYNPKCLSWIKVFRVRRSAQAKPGAWWQLIGRRGEGASDEGRWDGAGNWTADASCSTVIGWRTKATCGKWLTKTVRCKR
jgi:hypothetical protein